MEIMSFKDQNYNRRIKVINPHFLINKAKKSAINVVVFSNNVLHWAFSMFMPINLGFQSGVLGRQMRGKIGISTGRSRTRDIFSVLDPTYIPVRRPCLVLHCEGTIAPIPIPIPSGNSIPNGDFYLSFFLDTYICYYLGIGRTSSKINIQP